MKSTESTKNDIKTEKPKKSSLKRKRVDIEKSIKLNYKNHRKQTDEKNLSQDPAIIPLHSTVKQKDLCLDYNMTFLHLPHTTFHHEEQTMIEEQEKEKETKVNLTDSLNESATSEIIEELIQEQGKEENADLNTHILKEIDHFPPIMTQILLNSFQRTAG